MHRGAAFPLDYFIFSYKVLLFHCSIEPSADAVFHKSKATICSLFSDDEGSSGNSEDSSSEDDVR